MLLNMMIKDYKNKYRYIVHDLERTQTHTCKFVCARMCGEIRGQEQLRQVLKQENI